jgi:predicted  nucleic acid-binding Zn-ribbon protein
MELSEKNAELAALKASLEDTHEDSEEGVAKKDSAKLAAQERELKQLRGAAVDKETDISQLKTEISKLTQELDEAVANFEHLHVESESDKKALATVLAEKEELKEQLRAALESNKKALVATSVEKEELETLVKTLQEQLAASRSDLDSLHQAMESSNSKTVSHIMTLQSETVAAKAQVESLTTEVEELKGNLHFTSGRADHLEVELQEAKDALKKQEAEFAMKLADEIAKVHLEHEQLSADSPHSESTGVQIPAPSAAPPLVTKMPSNNGDDEEDWGDDWGDEDE